MSSQLRRAVPLLLATICACSTVVHVPPNGPNNDVALVYFIRKDLTPTAIRGKLFVNELLVATIADDSFAAVDVPAGKSTITCAFDFMDEEPVIFDIDVVANETRYLLITGLLEQVITRDWGLVYWYYWSKPVRVLNLAPPEAQKLLAEM